MQNEPKSGAKILPFPVKGKLMVSIISELWKEAEKLLTCFDTLPLNSPLPPLPSNLTGLTDVMGNFDTWISKGSKGNDGASSNSFGDTTDPPHSKSGKVIHLFSPKS